MALLDLELERIYKLAINNPSLNAKGKKYLRASQRGWIKGRDDAWKVKDQKRYVGDVYLFRIGEILQQHPSSQSTDNDGLSSGPLVYDCSGERTETYFIQTDPPRVILYQANASCLLTLSPSGSGSKYVGKYADGNIIFWSKGDEALLKTLEGKELNCAKKKHIDAVFPAGILTPYPRS